MVLTAANLYHYLADRGFTSPQSVVDGDFHVADLTRRNHAFQVSFRHRPGYVVQQVKKWRDSNVDTFESEAHWYWLARNHAGFAPLSRFLAKCCGYDSEDQILILEVPPGSEDLGRYHRRIGGFPVEIAQLLGDTLGAFHTALPASALDELRPGFDDQIPWVFFAHERADDSFEAISRANLELLKIARKYPGFGEALERLRQGWRRDTLINGDMKLAHCVLKSSSELYFIDWEMAAFGDPLWDAAAIVQEYLDAWIRSMPVAPDLSLEDAVARAECPLVEVQPAIRAFWQAYTGSAGADERAVDGVAAYVGARMIQRAYQSLQDFSQLHTRALRLLQLSLNILTEPAAAAHGLLGL